VIIDTEKCDGCGECVADCPGGVIELNDNNRAVPVKPEYCIQCGHCVAVCPNDAVTLPAYNAENFPSFQAEPLVGYDSLLALLRRRRSVRRYTDKPVPRDVIEQLIEAARYAPSGSNHQGCKYVVVDGHDAVRRLAGVVIGYYASILKMMESPIGRTYIRLFAGRRAYAGAIRYLPWFRKAKGKYEDGEDPLFYSTPLLIGIHADSGGYTTHADCVIAAYHMIMAAETLGLGSCFNGILTSAAIHSEDVRRAFGVPKGHRLYAAATFGYPAVNYRRAVDRFPPDVKWIVR
jgi:nitroreductase/NAD-dependent dihydropyrimidine dehydrogenase PreA subunit